MTRSGSVASIAYKLVDWVGKGNLLLVIAIIALMLTVGRVSPYVQIFILWPICVVFSKESNIPREIWIPVFYVGMLAAAAFPGSPTSTNAMLVQFLGVSAASAPVFSIFHVALYFILGMIYLRWQLKQWTNKGLKYVEHERDAKAVQVNRDDCSPFITSIIPMILVIITYSGFTGGWFGFKLNGIRGLPGNPVIMPLVPHLQFQNAQTAAKNCSRKVRWAGSIRHSQLQLSWGT